MDESSSLNNQQQESASPRYLHAWRWSLVVGWLSLVTAGFVALHAYKATAGAIPAAATRVPKAMLAEQNPRGLTLVMFAHPKCPCTRASLDELAVILARNPTLIPAQVVFAKPLGSDDLWLQDRLVRKAQQMTGVHVKWDEAQQLATQLDVSTSGHVLIYNRAGDVLFSGGITNLRGHAGWSSGHSAILAVADKKAPALPSTPVFGCGLCAQRTTQEIPQ